MITIHASQIHRGRACVPSVLGEGIQVEGDDQAARMGTAAHHILFSGISQGEHPEVAYVAAKFGIEDTDDFDKLVSQSWHTWKRVSHYFPYPECEVDLTYYSDPSDVTLSGRIDLLSGPPLRILDLKSGFSDSDHTDQLMAYAKLALNRYPDENQVYAAVLRPRVGELEGWTWTRHQIEEWWQQLLEELEKGRETYRVGAQCTYCPRGSSCPAKTDLLRQSVTAFFDKRPTLEEPASLGQLMDRIRLVEHACEQARIMVKAEVVARGGFVQTPDGRELVIREVQRQTISKMRLNNDMIEKLRECGAIQTTSYPKLEIRRCRR